jgi:hypothetical protein
MKEVNLQITRTADQAAKNLLNILRITEETKISCPVKISLL